MNSTPSLFRRVVVRAIVGVVIAGLVIAVFGSWMFLKDRSDKVLPPARAEAIAAGAAATGGNEQHRLELIAKISVMTQRVEESEKQIHQIEDLQKSWDLVSQNAARKRAAEERLEAAQRLHADDLAELAALKKDLASMTKDQAITRNQVSANSDSPEPERSLWPYFWRAWIQLWVWLGLGIALYSAGPLLWAAKRSDDARSLTVGSRAPLP
jgi:hypothetical protein